MSGHGSRRHHQLVRDLLVGAPVDQQAEHLELPRRQPSQVGHGGEDHRSEQVRCSLLGAGQDGHRTCPSGAWRPPRGHRKDAKTWPSSMQDRATWTTGDPSASSASPSRPGSGRVALSRHSTMPAVAPRTSRAAAASERTDLPRGPAAASRPAAAAAWLETAAPRCRRRARGTRRGAGFGRTARQPAPRGCRRGEGTRPTSAGQWPGRAGRTRSVADGTGRSGSLTGSFGTKIATFPPNSSNASFRNPNAGSIRNRISASGHRSRM